MLGLLVTVGLAMVAAAASFYRGAATAVDPDLVRETRTVTRGELLVSVNQKGTLESSRNVEIKCEIRGGYGGRGGHSMVTWVIPAGSFVKKGDELVRLDTKVIEETVSLGKTDTGIATAALARAQVDHSVAKTAVDGYLSGSYQQQMKSLLQRKELSEWNLGTSEKMLRNAKRMFRKGYVTRLEVEANEYTVEQAKLDLNVVQTEIDVLERLTKKMRLETLNGQVTATQARLKGREAGVDLEQSKLDLAEVELKNCSITAPRDGLVIYPSTAQWKDTPDIAKGVSVHNNQVLLLMPDLTRMQVTVGIHESIVGRVKAGMDVRVTVPGRTLDTTVASVDAVASPSGWWSGNVVNYDTTIQLPAEGNLRPGMSADVEIIVARHEDVLQIPLAALVETPGGSFCWVETSSGVERRELQIGDSNDQFIIVEKGIDEGEKVVIDPAATIAQAREMIAPTLVHKVSRENLVVSLTEQGTLESSNNTQVKCQVRGASTVNWVIESGTEVSAGDELVRLENKQIEEYIHERTKFAFLSRDAAIGFRANATVAGMAIPEYLEGRYLTELMGLEKELAAAEQRLRTATDMLNHTKLMQERGYRSRLDVEQRQSAVNEARLSARIKQIEIDVLKQFTKAEEVVRLKGNWESAKASANGHEEVLKADEARIAYAKDELDLCVVRAPRDGLVIYPRGKEWKDEPDIAEGTTVHNDQVLLLMPDLTQMQVRVGIHEGMLEKVKAGMPARVTLPGRTLDGEVVHLAPVAEPAGWWSGNIVKYDAIVELPSEKGLKPGMSAEVEILLESHEDELTVPLTAVVETSEGPCVWVGTPENAARRQIQPGPASGESVVVLEGLNEGEQVIRHPQAVLGPEIVAPKPVQ